MTENIHSAWAGTALTCHRAWRHGTARFSPDRAVPGLLSQHGGTSGTARRATVPLSAVPCRAVPDRASASWVSWSHGHGFKIYNPYIGHFFILRKFEQNVVQISQVCDIVLESLYEI